MSSNLDSIKEELKDLVEGQTIAVKKTMSEDKYVMIGITVPERLKEVLNLFCVKKSKQKQIPCYPDKKRYKVRSALKGYMTPEMELLFETNLVNAGWQYSLKLKRREAAQFLEKLDNALAFLIALYVKYQEVQNGGTVRN